MIVLIIIMLCMVGIFFQMERRDSLTRFSTYKKKAKVAQTTWGKISYIDQGQGEVIVSCHGICGGYDQAYDTLAGKVEKYRILAPARFGYPGSDMPKDATIDMQVEIFVDLLDQLSIDKTYLLATSAGGTTAIKFALMHPERTKGLILFCSGYPGITKTESEITHAGPPEFLCNDFAMWVISPFFKPMMGMEQKTIRSLMPLKERKAGIVFDASVTNIVMNSNYQEYDMTNIKVPVLIIHATDDKLAKFEDAKMWADRIPDCTFVPLTGGGHLMEGHEKEVDKALDDFIKKTANIVL